MVRISLGALTERSLLCAHFFLYLFREGAKRKALLGTQFLVVATSQSHYLLWTVTSQDKKSKNWGKNNTRSIKTAKIGV